MRDGSAKPYHRNNCVSNNHQRAGNADFHDGHKDGHRHCNIKPYHTFSWICQRALWRSNCTTRGHRPDDIPDLVWVFLHVVIDWTIACQSRRDMTLSQIEDAIRPPET